jgi:hypothetical protein
MSLGSDSGSPTGLGSALGLTPAQQAQLTAQAGQFNNTVAPAAYYPSYQTQAASQGTVNPSPAVYTSPLYVPQMTQAPQLPGNPGIFNTPLGAQQYGASLGFVAHAPRVGVALSPEALAAQQAAAAAAYANTPAGRAAAAAAAARAGNNGNANASAGGDWGGDTASNTRVPTGNGLVGSGGGDGIASDSDDGVDGDDGANGVDGTAAASDSDSGVGSSGPGGSSGTAGTDSDAAASAAAAASDSDSGDSGGDGGGDGG